MCPTCVLVFPFAQGITLTVKTDGSHSLEENMRQTLLACYREFSDILKQLNIIHVGNHVCVWVM